MKNPDEDSVPSSRPKWCLRLEGIYLFTTVGLAACYGDNALKKRIAIYLFTIVVCLGMIQGAAQAEPLAYEGFDYTSGEDLSGQGGAGNGWSGSWSGARSSASVDTPGMTYSGLPTTGNRVDPLNTFGATSRNLDVNGTNTYSGGTTIDGGTVSVGAVANLGAAGSGLTWV